MNSQQAGHYGEYPGARYDEYSGEGSYGGHGQTKKEGHEEYRTGYGGRADGRDGHEQRAHGSH